jgi:hypothetical protein
MGSESCVLLVTFAIFAIVPALGGAQTIPELQAPLIRVPDGGKLARALDSMMTHPEQAVLGIVKLPV